MKTADRENARRNGPRCRQSGGWSAVRKLVAEETSGKMAVKPGPAAGKWRVARDADTGACEMGMRHRGHAG